MKNIAKLSLVLIVFSSALNAEDIERPNPTDIPSQHTVVISLSALFYCGLDRWPESLSELKEFQTVNEIQLGIESNWPWLLSSEFTYTASNVIDLYSESPSEEGNLIKVTSGQEMPSCTDGNTEMQGAHLNVDFGE